MAYGIRALSHERLDEAYARAWAVGAWETINAIRREIDRRSAAKPADYCLTNNQMA